MPKDKSEEPEEAVAQFDFVLRSLTLTDMSKVPGAERYSSREFGVPFATFDLDWPGKVTVTASPEEPLEELKAAVLDLMRWLKGTGVELGREVVADIKLDRADAALDDVPGVDIDAI